MEPKPFGRYLVYPDGRVWTSVYGRFLSGGQTKGYRTYFLSGKWHYAHRLVAELFIPNPHGLPQVNHIDSNRANSVVVNLEWVTAKGNAEHASRNGRLQSPRRMAAHVRHRKYSQELRDRALTMTRTSGLSLSRIAKELGATKRWVHLMSKATS